MSPTIEINGRKIGPGYPTFIVAEISANHHQEFDEAVKIIKIAKEIGVDAVKIQTYTPDTITLKSNKEYFRLSGGTLWDGKTLYELYSEALTPWEWQPKLKKIADEIDLPLFSSAFDPTAVDFLETMNVPAYKVASPELVDIPLIEKMARTGKPMIISTGMATLQEIEEAMQAAKHAGAGQIALLKCTSAYPALPEEANLRTLEDLRQRFHVPIGISDHTLGMVVPIAAVSLGASLIEKHLTLSKKRPGPDSAFSLEPDEFSEMVRAVRVAEKSLGQVHYGGSPTEANSRRFRRSLFVVDNIKSGDVFTEKNVRSIRPAHGLPPRHLPAVLGKRAARDIERGTPLSWDLIDGN